MRFSVSKVNAFAKCPKAGYYRYEEELMSKKPKTALSIGKAIHEGLEWWESHPDKSMSEYLLTIFDVEQYEPEDYERIQDVLLNYEYMVDEGLLPPMRVKEHEIELKTKLAPGIDFLGYIDGLVEAEDGNLWILERKTYPVSPPYKTAMYSVQTHMYKKLYGKKIVGVIFEYIKSKPGSAPKKLKSGKYSVSETAKNNMYPYYVAKAIRNREDIPADLVISAMGNVDKFVQRNYYYFDEDVAESVYDNFLMACRDIKKRHTSGQYPRSIGEMTCGMCEFRELCEAEMCKSDVEYIKDELYTKRDRR